VADFDIQRFVKLSGPVAIDDLDWQEAGRAGVTDTEARILRYMADTETHTILYLRDLLAGHSAHDPEVTAFLSVWVYEELWHGRAIDMLLSAAGRPVPQDTFTQVSKNVSWREPIEALGSHLAANATPRFAAVHMAWGAINELTAAAAYKVLERRTHNKPLALLLNRLMKQERKHFSFYYHQAQKRLADDRWAQRLCTWVLKAAWTPVGSGVGHGDNMGFVAQNLFDDKEGRAILTDIDATIQKLPGLAWFDLVGRRVQKVIDVHNRDHANGPTAGMAKAAAA
jgi:hypothetical protein